ncbi:MAG: ATP-binding protein [Candidatus Eremiobacteraeota bacterium]|nr:ATP-binding protein [Candidatus Eremiobacteraeota bacterium]MCW5870043.1 ATP-binding protein [Candidatus Eremiobacteraeota bacterium]
MAEVGRFLTQPEGSFFLFGPRGTGKSTWLRQHFPEALWLDLLDPELSLRLLANPSLLREMLEAQPQTEHVVIDEVQRAPELLTLVHQLIEERRARFALTGSSARKLKRSGVDLLAGRAGLRAMHPFLAAELGPAFELGRALQFGLLPLVWSAPEPRETLRGYVGLYLREEVQQEGLVRRIDYFSRFLEAISFSHGALLNLSEVARECQVSRKTVEGYLEILEDLLLAFRLPVFTKRAQRQLAAHPKFYLFDAGVFQSLRPRGLLDSPAEVGGQALEGLVAQHLRAWVDLSREANQLYYWRTRAGNEVDFVVYGESGFWAIEVKSSAAIQPKDLSGLRAFGADYPEASLLLLHGGRDRYLRDKVLCWPVDAFLRGLRPGQPIR